MSFDLNRFRFDISSDEKPDDPTPPLVTACIGGNLSRIQDLCNPYNASFPHAARTRKFINASRHWTEIDHKDSGFTKSWEWNSYTPIAAAAMCGHAEVVQYLLVEFNADPTLAGMDTVDGDACDAYQAIGKATNLLRKFISDLKSGIVPRFGLSVDNLNKGSSLEAALYFTSRLMRFERCSKILDAVRPFWSKSSYSSIHYQSGRGEFTNLPSDSMAMRVAVLGLEGEREPSSADVEELAGFVEKYRTPRLVISKPKVKPILTPQTKLTKKQRKALVKQCQGHECGGMYSISCTVSLCSRCCKLRSKTKKAGEISCAFHKVKTPRTSKKQHQVNPLQGEVAGQSLVENNPINEHNTSAGRGRGINWNQPAWMTASASTASASFSTAVSRPLNSNSASDQFSDGDASLLVLGVVGITADALANDVNETRAFLIAELGKRSISEMYDDDSGGDRGQSNKSDRIAKNTDETAHALKIRQATEAGALLRKQLIDEAAKASEASETVEKDLVMMDEEKSEEATAADKALQAEIDAKSEIERNKSITFGARITEMRVKAEHEYRIAKASYERLVTAEENWERLFKSKWQSSIPVATAAAAAAAADKAVADDKTAIHGIAAAANNVKERYGGEDTTEVLRGIVMGGR